jgi:hypothetical protein
MLSHQELIDDCALGMLGYRASHQVISPELRTERIPFSPGMRLQVAAFSIRRKVTIQ